MNALVQPRLAFDGAEAVPEEPFVVDLEVWEGPIHVLLELARRQKVDLLTISVTRLADQFLAFVREAGSRRFELAADYLVMAAWLAYLKSRLLLPKTAAKDGESLSAEETALRLAERLARLDRMRRASAALEARPVLKRDVFTRGDPEATTVVSLTRLEGDLFGLVRAYAGQRVRAAERTYRPPGNPAWRLDDAREHLRLALPRLADWTTLAAVAPEAEAGGPCAASLTASTLSAVLEFVREGELDARQERAFAEIYLKAREP